MPDLGIFGQEFENSINIFEISTLEFVKTEFFTHTVNSCIRSVFSKSPKSWVRVPFIKHARS